MTRAARALHAAVAAALLAVVASTAAAETWPARPIKIINPFAPGGFGDVVLRPMMDRLSQVLGQPVVIESHVVAAGGFTLN
jgi:tripartite-type tricarboxylate transporter receptor subunit TctC